MRIGILGAGQLGMMLAQAAQSLGLDPVLYDQKHDACGFAVAEHVHAAFDDIEALKKFARGCDVCTCEFENVPQIALQTIAAVCPLFPTASAFAIAADRAKEKKLFDSLQIPVPDYWLLDSERSIAAAKSRIAEGHELIVKTTKGGYDGKGQTRCTNPEDLHDLTANSQVLLIAEEKIDYQHELSLIVARSTNGEITCFPPVVNYHDHGILQLSLPMPKHPLEAVAKQHANDLVEHLEYVGVLAFEFFVTKNGALLANEFAPRVHNSGHWTIEGSRTSQFTQHLLAITGQPLGNTSCTGYSLLCNLVSSIPQFDEQSSLLPGCYIHDYDKQPAPKRKLGHITLQAELHNQFIELVDHYYSKIYTTTIPEPIANFIGKK